jgi:deazaflavin-dependent oxidoreductase (nitroreductase family)
MSATSTRRRARLPLAGRLFSIFTPYLNQSVARIAGDRFAPWALLRHRGRRSGRDFATPVVAFRVAGGFAIPLAFGESSDWFQNVVVAGEGTLRLRGRECAFTAARMVDVTSPLLALSAWKRAMVRAAGIPGLAYLQER